MHGEMLTLTSSCCLLKGLGAVPGWAAATLDAQRCYACGNVPHLVDFP